MLFHQGHFYKKEVLAQSVFHLVVKLDHQIDLLDHNQGLPHRLLFQDHNLEQVFFSLLFFSKELLEL